MIIMVKQPEICVIVCQGASFADFYVKSNGRVSHRNDSLQAGVVYRVEPRLCGGKGGKQQFGSNLKSMFKII